MNDTPQGNAAIPPSLAPVHPVRWVLSFFAFLFMAALLSLFLPWPGGAVFPTVAIVLGSVRWLRNEDGSVRRTEGGAMVLAGVVGIGLAWTTAPNIDYAREAAKRASCQLNLKVIGVACEAYGRQPPRLSALYPAYLPDLEYFVCPDSPNRVGPADRIDEWTDYELAPADADWLCRDKRNDLHIPGGRNVLYPDGRVEFVREVVWPNPSSRAPAPAGPGRPSP